MTLKELISALGCSKYPERWESIYSEAVEIYESKKIPFSTPNITTLFTKNTEFLKTLSRFTKEQLLLLQRKRSFQFSSVFFAQLCATEQIF